MFIHLTGAFYVGNFWEWFGMIHWLTMNNHPSNPQQPPATHPATLRKTHQQNYVPKDIDLGKGHNISLTWILRPWMGDDFPKINPDRWDVFQTSAVPYAGRSLRSLLGLGEKIKPFISRVSRWLSLFED